MLLVAIILVLLIGALAIALSLRASSWKTDEVRALVYAGVVEKAKEADFRFKETKEFKRKFNESFRNYNSVNPKTDSEDVKDLFIDEIAEEIFEEIFDAIKNAST